MSLATNIVRYRKRNKLTQEQLATDMNLSRQSISRWETGENLPSIDNLISLSGLLNISLDELITGAPYLHFPFDYGRPTSHKPVIWLIIFLLLIDIPMFGGVNENIWIGIGLGLFFSVMFYTLYIYFLPWDFKPYYTYWTIDQKGIRHVRKTKFDDSVFKELIIPIKAFFHLRKTEYVSFQQIKKVEIKLPLYELRPNTIITAFGWGDPTVTQSMRERFYFEITTKDNQVIHLDLSEYYWGGTKEHQVLPAIISYLQRQNFEYVDRQGISEIVKGRSGVLVNELYARQDIKQALEGKQ